MDRYLLFRKISAIRHSSKATNGSSLIRSKETSIMENKTQFLKLFNSKSLKLYDKLKICKIEREVEDVYNEGLSFYFSNIDIQHPYACDGCFKTTTGNGSMLKMIIEYKFNDDMKQKIVIAKVLVQVIYYLKKFELNGIELPNVVMVGDINECFVMHSNELLKYLDRDIDWTIAPSSAPQKNQKLVSEIIEDEAINPYVFWVDESFDFKSVVEKIHNLCENVKRYVRITEHNIASIFEYFRDRVLIKKDALSANELVTIFIGLITNEDTYCLHPKKKNTLITPNGNIPVNSASFVSFFEQYAREYTPQERMNFTAIADRLIEDTTRRRQGAFFTPVHFTDFSHRMIEKELGENWRDEYVVYDCCWGTGGLTRDYRFKELYCSTLDKGELEMGSRYNPEAVKWQMDFLNDGDDKLDKGLIQAFKENKPIVFFINPPYGTACNQGQSSKKDTNNTAIRDEMNETKFGGSENLQHQFMYRITKIVQKYNLTNAYFALFSKPIWLSGAKQGKFLKNFSSQWECKDAYLFQASHFADVSDAWGISLTLWKSNNQATPITEYNMKLIDILDDGTIDVLSHHTIYNSAFFNKASDWVKEYVKCKNDFVCLPTTSNGLVLKEASRVQSLREQLGYFHNNANSIQYNQTYVGLYSMSFASGNGVPVCAENFTRCTTLFTARKLIEGNWINDKDEYLAPNENHSDYKRFEADSIVYSLFHNSSNQTSMRQTTYKGKLYDIPNEFFWMSKDTMMSLANENNDDFMFNDARTSNERYVYMLLNKPEIAQHLSETAKQLLSMATEMTVKSMKYRDMFEADYPDHHIHTWDAGYYQLKNLWKEYIPDDFKQFRDLFKQFSNELRPLVYSLGFLRN